MKKNINQKTRGAALRVRVPSGPCARGRAETAVESAKRITPTPRRAYREEDGEEALPGTTSTQKLASHNAKL